MPTTKDIVTEAREFNTDISACGIDPQKAHELINALADEVERLREQTPELRQRERKQLFTVIDIRGCDRCELCEVHQ